MIRSYVYIANESSQLFSKALIEMLPSGTHRGLIMIAKHFFIGVLLGASLTAHSRDMPVSRLGDSAAFDTIDGAAVAALHIAMPASDSSNREYGGGILRCDGVYRYTEPVAGQSFEVPFGVAVPVTCALAAIYHTHPNHHIALPELFSASDVKQAKALKVRSYIGVLSNGTMRVYDPATMGHSTSTQGFDRFSLLDGPMPGAIVR